MAPLRTTFAAALLLATAGCTEARAPGEPAEPSEPTSAASSPTAGPLDWQPTGRSAEERFIQGDGWTVSVDGGSATFVGPDGEVVVRSDGARDLADVQLGDDYGLVVSEDPAGDAPQVATIVDLTSGETRPVTDPAPAAYGDWLLEGATLSYGTTNEDGAYCLAEADAATGTGSFGSYCAEPRHGFSGLTATPSGVTLLAFDDRRPVSCRTPGWLTDAGFEPFPHVNRCRGWDTAATPAGVVWSEVPRARRQEQARFFATVDGQVNDLGPGNTGSLVACGGSVFFTRDSSRRNPARLMQWTAAGELEVAFEAKGPGQSFLGDVTCAGRTLTLSSYSEAGDEQVSAAVTG